MALGIFCVSIAALLSTQYGAQAMPAAAEAANHPMIKKLCEGATKPQHGLYPNETMACAAEVGLKLEDLVKADFGSPDFDDKCWSKCAMIKTGLMSEDGNPLEEKITGMIKTFFPAELHENFIGRFNGCITEADKKVEAHGGRKKAPCPFSLHILQCLMHQEIKFCKEEAHVTN